MDNKVEVLNRLLDEINLSLQQVCDRIDMLSDKKQEISQNLKELYDNEDNLKKRKKVLEEIINDENLKLGIIKTEASEGIIVGMDMGPGPDSSPNPYMHHMELINTGEIHITKSSIAQGTAEGILKQMDRNYMERNYKHGKV